MEPFNQTFEDVPPRQKLLEHQATLKPFKFEKIGNLRDYKKPKAKQPEVMSYDAIIAQEIVKSKNSHLGRELKDLIYETIEKPLGREPKENKEYKIKWTNDSPIKDGRRDEKANAMRQMLDNIKDSVVQIDGLKVHDGRPTLKDRSNQKYEELKRDPRVIRNHLNKQNNEYLDDIYIHRAKPGTEI